MSADEKAIRDIMPAWFDATQREDIDALVGMMTEDMLFLTPGRKPFGREEFVAGSRANPGQFDFEFNGNYEEVVVEGTLAYARGFLEVTFIPRNGGPRMEMSGYTLSVFRKGMDGRWRLARDANFVGPKK